MLDTLLAEWRTLYTPSYSDEFIVRTQTPGYCSVMCAGSLESVADEIIQREIEVHDALGRDFEWTLYDSDLPSDMLDRLQSFGFEVGTKEVICGIAVDTAFFPEDSAIRVERVRDEKGLGDFRTVAEAVFEKDFSYTTSVLADCLEKRGTHQTGFVAYDGDMPVSIGRLDKVQGGVCAGLYTGGTLSAYRGMGYYRALVWERIRYAKELGAKIVWVDAKPTSLPILQRLGFEPLAESWPCDKRF